MKFLEYYEAIKVMHCLVMHFNPNFLLQFFLQRGLLGWWVYFLVHKYLSYNTQNAS